MSKVVLVTGASPGVGGATATLLAQHGWTVYGLSRRGTAPEGTTGLSADVTQPETLHQAVQRILTEQGHLDAVLHCAGIGGAGPVEQIPLVEAQRIVDTNFWGAFHVNRAVLPHLRQREPGDIATDIIAAQYRMPYEEVDPTYRAAYTAADSGMAENVEHGMPPSAVAEFLYDLLQKDSLKIRYVLGEPIQKVSTYAKRLLPGRWYERILAGYYRL